MPLWGKSNDDKEQERLQQEAIAALRRGDIPPVARRRIEEHVAGGKSCFSSDLSVREFLLAQESGVKPISQVFGTCFYNVGYISPACYGLTSGNSFGGYSSIGNTREIVGLTEAQTTSRQLAMSRMKQEAQLLGASGVIGVRLKVTRPDMSHRSCEFTAYGTAVHLPGYRHDAEPFTSDLNGQEFWLLYKSGYLPCGLVLGVCSYYIISSSFTQYQTASGTFSRNQEVYDYTQGFIEARRHAESRLMREVSELGACGVVGMHIDYDIEEVEIEQERAPKRRDLIVNFVAMGTAVKEISAPFAPEPKMFIDLRRNKIRQQASVE